MLTLNWDNLDTQTREEILSGACLNSRFAHYDWHEMEEWLRDIITDNIKLRSKNTVSILG